jgi:hypothetical protein
MNFHWLSRRKRVAELNEELESHVTMAAKDLVARGALKTAAAHAARRELGNFSLVREVTQDAWGGRWWRDLLEDSRHGLRILRNNPGFTAVAVLTLALGIGANTAIFTVLNSAVLKSLPVAHPEELVVLTDPDAHGSQFGSQTGDRSLLAYSLYAPLFNPMWEQAAAIYEVRTFADPSSVSVSLRKAVEETSASLPAIEIHTMSGLVDDSLEADRFIEKLAGAFGILAMLLASIGLYGIMAYIVACRTRDIGIRLALGAEKENVLWQVLRETMALVLIGTAIGVPLAMGATHLVKSMLFGLGFADPIAILFAAAVLSLVAAVAGLLPAWRASQVDPMVALRHE